ncbi:hypothetical protein FZEAL_7056 [Fusarium zealandicum]|uniref:Pre-mRNA polyadenylation factor Fip1 domain-containing protein n=1 Tax=Fusarium zealandicum TaxID=1053134 RepID=A0A8H4UGJ2_9HYPO|nr:hypothetical protein FZEAL_7056 [Fusarium zealandicum]
MDIDEDDDLYVPEEPKVDSASPDDKKPKIDDLEEGEEEDEGAAMDEDDDDSDIDIITERKDGTKPAPPPQSKYSDIRNIPQRTASNDMPSQPAPVKKESESQQSSIVNVAAPSADKTSAAASKSTIDVNANPIHAASGKPITQVNIDEDLPENEKPWRKPGTDISDYFNYGFDEFTWALYASKQETVRSEFGADVFAQNNKKMMEEFNMMMMGGMGMPGGGSGGSAGGMPGMDNMAPEMQQMMQQMMASGMDPSQMDPSQMNAMFAGMQNAGGAGGQGAQGGQGGNFGGGFGGNQGFSGYEQNMSGGGGGGGRGGFGGGRGRRGRW